MTYSLNYAAIGISPARVSTAVALSAGYLLFFLVLTFPATNNLTTIKMALLAVSLSLLAIQTGAGLRIHLHPTVVLWALFLVAVGLFFCLRGMFMGAPGAVNSLRVYAIWPLIYLALISGVRNARVLRHLGNILIISTVFLGLFGVYLYLSAIHVLPEIPYANVIFATDEWEYFNWAGEPGSYVFAGSSPAGTYFTYPGLNALPFLVPFIIAAAMYDWQTFRTRAASRIVLLIGVLTTGVVAYLSGRRALQLTVLTAPLMTIAFAWFQSAHDRSIVLSRTKYFLTRGSILILVFVALFHPINQHSFERFTDRMTAGFSFTSTSEDDSSRGRQEQYLALTRGWIEHPFVGAGLGASAEDSSRSLSQPWAYELYYVALLYQTGLIGLAIYAAAIAWIYYSALKLIRRSELGGRFMVPILVGMSSFLFANATNPYLPKFDGLWAIFLPIAVINHWLLVGKDFDCFIKAASVRPSRPSFSR